MRELRKLEYRVSYSRPDGTDSPFGILPAYATSIKAKLSSLMLDYYRIASADVQSTVMQGSLIGASLVVEELTGLVLFPRRVTVDFTRFPVYDRVLEIPRGPLMIDGGNTFSIKYTTDQLLPFANTAPYTIDGDTNTGDTICRLFQDKSFPYLAIISGQIWPVPLWAEPFPVRVVGTYGMFNPAVWAASTAEECYIQYAAPLTVLFQLALHLYENRMPVNIGNTVNDIPYTLKTLVRSLKRA